MSFLRAPRVVTAALILTQVGCQEPTQVTIDLNTDALCAGDPTVEDVFNSATFYVRSGADIDAPVSQDYDAITQPGQCEAGDPLNHIGTLGLVPGSSGSDGSVGLRILVGVGEGSGENCVDAGCGDPNCIDIQRRVSFIPNRSLVLPITASRNCLGLCCEDGQTCVDGACVDVDVDPCNPDEETCVPDDVTPVLGPRWTFGVRDGGFRVTAMRTRVASDGSLIVVLAGSYPPASANGNTPRFGDLALQTGTGTGVFMARIVVTDTGDGRVDEVASCVGASLIVHDVDFDDSGPRALLTTSGRFDCQSGDSFEVPNIGGQSRPLLWSLGPSGGPNGTEALTPLTAVQNGNQASVAAESLLIERDGDGVLTGLHVTGRHNGGGASLTFGGEVKALPASETPYFYRAPFPTAAATNKGPVWTLGLPETGVFDDAQAHQVVQASTGPIWHVGQFDGYYAPLAGVLAGGGPTVFATSVAAPDPSMVVSGGVVRINRARPLRGTGEILVPIQLDPAVYPELRIGGAPSSIDERTAALLKFSPGAPPESGAVSVVLSGTGGEHPHGAGAGALTCLAFDRAGRGVISCVENAEVTFGNEVEMMGLDMAIRPAQDGVWIVMLGRANGELGIGFPAAGIGDDETQFFVAGFRVP